MVVFSRVYGTLLFNHDYSIYFFNSVTPTIYKKISRLKNLYFFQVRLICEKLWLLGNNQAPGKMALQERIDYEM